MKEFPDKVMGLTIDKPIVAKLWEKRNQESIAEERQDWSNVEVIKSNI